MTAAAWPIQHSVLLVDDEPQTLRSYALLLQSGGIQNVKACDDSRRVLDEIARAEISSSDTAIGVVLLDLMMPHLSGEALLPQLLESHPDIPVIVLTAANSVDAAVRCMRLGVFDYMVKPVEESRLLSGVRRALELRDLRQENTRLSRRMLSDQLEHPEAFAPIVTRSRAMRAVFKYIEAVAGSAMPILITGETGVGKEHVARIVHQLSGRPGRFVPVNIAGLDDTLFSDTLFGHERGAFTGAEQSRAGLIENARSGTLFLDEIGELSPVSQVKLLRVLQEREFLRVGSDIPRISDARIVAATNRSPDDLLASGSFRKDLFFRLQTHLVRIPPLRERPEDIPLLLECLLQRAAEALHKTVPPFPPSLVSMLATYSFPGNVRELEAMIFDALSHHASRTLFPDSIRQRVEAVRGKAAPAPFRTGEPTFTDLPSNNGSTLFTQCDELPTLRESARLLTAEAMHRSGGNQTAAARLLGISQSALSRRLRQEHR